MKANGAQRAGLVMDGTEVDEEHCGPKSLDTLQTSDVSAGGAIQDGVGVIQSGLD